MVNGQLKERREKATDRGRPPQGGQAGGCPRNKERPPRAGNKRPRYAMRRGRHSGPGYFGRDPNGEGPEARRITTAFVSGGEPRLPGRTDVQEA